MRATFLAPLILLAGCSLIIDTGELPPDNPAVDSGHDAAIDATLDSEPDGPPDAWPDGPPDSAYEPPDTTVDPIDQGKIDGPPTCDDDDEDGYGEGCAAGPDCDDNNPDVHPGAEETCNARDDDCDEATDEGVAGVDVPCTVGVGACAVEGQQRCTPEGDLTCDAVADMARPERCNGIDDDCDDAVDETWPDLGEPCTVGVGACMAEGVRACAEDGTVICDAGPGAGGEETCNGADDDCDGTVDEGFEVGEVCTSGQGLCAREGQLACDADGERYCDAPAGDPRPETCDGRDEDCDGSIDEDFAIGQPCTAGLGVCAADGVRVCDTPARAVCSATPGMASPEQCNMLDDDCDGSVDENFLVGARCQNGLGACRANGVVECRNGDAVCNAVPGEPQPEECNGFDDDCDDAIDEGFLLAFDDRRCGACDRACDPGSVCLGGQCQAAPFIFDGTLHGAGVPPGWQVCHQGIYSERVALQPILDRCQGDYIMYGCRQVGDVAWTLLAMGARTAVLRPTGGGSANLTPHNGVQWYFDANISIGFAPLDAEVNRNGCDVADPGDDDRLCWHANAGQLSGGWRCGAATALNGSADWERAIWTR
ncbi:MAG: putative metal-binding motif-containing protein [Myxococcales bacterium]|nr:putative metal-binding motif-containing protein [Myxococcales bacterium]